VLAFVSPVSNLGSYYFAENAIVAPIAASSVLVNLLFARLFLAEGKLMNKFTILGIIFFVTGLFFVVFTYSNAVGEVNDDNIDFGVVSLFFGIWIFIITFLTNIANVFNTNHMIQLVCWSGTAGLLFGCDIVASMDKWLFVHERDDWNEIGKVILATVFYGLSCGLNIFILNELLLDPEIPLHVVATIISSVALFCDVIADCFVFSRYKDWDSTNYIMTIVGLFFMIGGIYILHTKKEHSTVQQTPEDEEEIDLIPGTIGIDTRNMQTEATLTPPPSLAPRVKNVPQPFY
jgi:hypothetical protein